MRWKEEEDHSSSFDTASAGKEREEVLRVKEAFHFFRKHVNPFYVDLIRHVVFSLEVPRCGIEGVKVLRGVADMAEMLPKARVVVGDTEWEIVGRDDDAIEEFLGDGEALERVVAKSGFASGRGRNWIVMPLGKGRQREWLLRRSLESGDARRALQWMDYGL
jgi:hypothetical protein